MAIGDQCLLWAYAMRFYILNARFRQAQPAVNSYALHFGRRAGKCKRATPYLLCICHPDHLDCPHCVSCTITTFCTALITYLSPIRFLSHARFALVTRVIASAPSLGLHLQGRDRQRCFILWEKRLFTTHT